MFAIAQFGRVFAAAILIASGLAMTPVSAQTARGPSPAAVGLAKELLALKGGAEMFNGMVVGVIETAKNSFVPNNPNLAKPLNDVAVQLRKEFDPKKEELFNQVAAAYARHFTEQEMREMLAFYKTTLGRKVLKTEAIAVEDGFKRAQDWTSEFSDVVLSRMRAEMRKRGHEL